MNIRVSTNNFQYAPAYKRLAAMLIDVAITDLLVLAFVPGAMALFNSFSDLNTLFNFLIGPIGVWFFVVNLIYLFLTWGLLSKSIGMMLMKIRIADLSGASINWLTALIRLIGFAISAAIALLGFVPVLFDAKKQGLHDKIAKTIVILKR